MLRGIASIVLLALVVIEASAETPEPGTLIVLGLCLLGMLIVNNSRSTERAPSEKSRGPRT